MDIQQLPEIEETLASLSKSIERLRVQAEKQQIMLTTITVDLVRGQKASMSKSENLGSKKAAGAAIGRLVTNETTVHLTNETNETHNSSETSGLSVEVSLKKSRCQFFVVSIRIHGCLGLTGTSISISCRNRRK